MEINSNFLENHDDATELLSYVYQNSKMGSQHIAQIIPKVENQCFQSELMDQLSQYQRITNKASQMLQDMSVAPKTSILSNIGVKAGITLSTLTDTSPSHIAEVLINSSTMGVIDMTKKLNQCNNCTNPVNDICQELINLTERNVDNLKVFL